MNKANTKYVWKDLPTKETAIAARKLNEKEDALDLIDDRVVAMDTSKANQTDLLSAMSDFALNNDTGVITVTYKNGTTKTINTNINKIATNFRWDSATETLYLIMPDGTETAIDLSSLISTFDFVNSTTISFTVSNGTVTASVIDGSITESKLQPNFLADIKVESAKAESGATTAESKSLVAEGWSQGTQNGVPVTSGSPYFENNAKYWAQQASGGATVSALTISNVSLTESDWSETEEYEDYTYSANVTLQGVTADYVPYATFDVESATSGVLAPICEAVSGAVKIYASEPIECVIKSIIAVKGVSE